MHPHHHDASQPADLMGRADRICTETGRKFTPLRRRVFRELAESVTALGAYDLVERLGRERRISPISVYRALDFLIEADLIHRIAVRNTYLPCHHAHHPSETIVFLVCTQCGGVDELTSTEIARDLRDTAAAAGFKAQSRSVELEGECSSCQTGS